MNQYPLIRGQTDLKARNPALAEEWDGIRNKGLTPEDVQPGSVKKSGGGAVKDTAGCPPSTAGRPGLAARIALGTG